jgi:hypothetical protein
MDVFRVMVLCRSLAFSKGKRIASELRTDYYLEPERIVTEKYLELHEHRGSWTA